MLKIALVGLPNVGKSTLFNRLTNTRDALVSDTPGLTRDHRIGVAESGGRRWLVYDTGGLGDTDAMGALIAGQTERAIGEADIVALVVDMRAGVVPAEAGLAARLRATGKPVWLLVNKSERAEAGIAAAEFAGLGFEPTFAISAKRGSRIRELLDAMADASARSDGDDGAFTDAEGVRVCIVGRPNAGKSTLTNQLLGEERMLVSDEPGTTRDSVAAPFEHAGRAFTLVDTAGVRRRRGVRRGAETLSVLQTFESMALSDVAILVCDASEGVSAQDARLAARALDAGCGLVVALNKSDLLTTDAAQQHLERTADLSFPFMDYVTRHRICARTGDGVNALLQQVALCHESAHVQVSTSRCTRILNEALDASPPPMAGRHRPSLRYANQAGVKPPRFILHGRRVDALPAPYRRYLVNYYRRALGLSGVPVVLEFRSATNPYAADR